MQTYTVHIHSDKYSTHMYSVHKEEHSDWLELSCHTSLNWEMNPGWLLGSIPDKNLKAYWGFTIKI